MVYVNNSITSLVHSILSDTIANIVGLNTIVANSIPSNTTSPHAYNGLLSNLVYAVSKNLVLHYKLHIKESMFGTQFLVLVDVTGTKEANDSDVLVIDGRNPKILILMEYYTLIYEYMMFCMNSIKLANKPIFKINDLRVQNNSLDKNDIRQQVQHLVHALKRMNGLGILDAKDSVELIQNDISKYETILDIAYGGMSATMSLPRSYLAQDTSSNPLGDTGEGDRIILERTLERTYTDFLKPILDRIYDIVGLPKDYTYQEYEFGRVKSVADMLPVLENTTLLTYEEKRNFIVTELGLKTEEDKLVIQEESNDSRN